MDRQGQEKKPEQADGLAPAAGLKRRDVASVDGDTLAADHCGYNGSG
jgi:hypothetical protein